MATRRSPRTQQLRTFADVFNSRPTDPASQRKARSFNLPEDLVARTAATMRGVQALTYGTDIAGKVPDSLTRAVQDAMEAWNTFWEDQLNEGELFPPATLSAGPGPRGAKEGAAKRTLARQAKAADGEEAEAAPTPRKRTRATASRATT